MTAQTKVFFLTKCFVLLSCIRTALVEDLEFERLRAELQLNDLELVDICEDLAKGQKTALLTQNYEDQIEQEQILRFNVKSHYEVLRSFTVVPMEVERNWTYQVKPGEALLPEKQISQTPYSWFEDLVRKIALTFSIKFIVYKNHMALLLRQSKFRCTNEPELCLVGQADYHSALNNERNFESLRSTWQSWQKIFKSNNFTSNLKLIKEAATLNEFESVQDYWEGLIDFSGAYQQAAEFWEEISPFYKKLQAFIRTRLFKFYNIENHSEGIPSFLLGGNLGTDWSNIADVVLPHPQLHYDARSYLQYKDTKAIYKYSESIATNLGLSGMTAKFWTNSNFNSTYCKSQLFEFCHSAYTEVSDCNKTSWSRYLDVHEATLKVALNDLDYTSLPRYHLRYCSIDDAVAKLGSILAVESLDYHGVVSVEAGDESAKMTKLLLVALRIMPRLAYSFMVDKWRIELLEQNSSNVADLWWKFRKEYMGVEGIDNVELEFLEDAKILSNQPYLSEFFGTLIAFQLMSFYAERSSDLQNIAMEFGQDETFRNLIQLRHTTDWPYLLTTYYGFDLSSSELLKYFEPLEQYFETVPLDQAAIVTTTTTTTSTSTTTTTTTTVAPTKIRFESNLDKVVNDEPKVNSSIKNLKEDKARSEDDHSAMYLGVGIVVVLSCGLAAAFTYKKVKRKAMPNNRRFHT